MKAGESSCLMCPRRCNSFLFGVIVQDLCAICTDFIIAELWTSNFLAYQVPDSCVGLRFISFVDPMLLH